MKNLMLQLVSKKDLKIRFHLASIMLAIFCLTNLGLASPASAAPINVKCVGVNNDVAGIVSGAPKTSREILTLAGSLVGISSLPPFPTTVTTDAPERVGIGTGDYNVTLTYDIRVPAEIAALLRDNLGVSTVLVKTATMGTSVTGPVAATVTKVASDTTLDLNNPASSVGATMEVTVSSKNSGRIFFRPTPITMSLKIDGSVAGVATVGTVNLECDAQGVIASTVVQVKGTPITPAVIDGPTVPGGQTVTAPLLSRNDFIADDGNAILPDSLRIIKGSNGAYVANGNLIQPTSTAGDTYLTELEVCAPSRLTADTPGIDEIQAMAFPSNYRVQPGLELFNPHPLGMKLSFNGHKTAEIPLTTLYGTGLEYFGEFVAPSASQVKAALVALPNIGADDIDVTRETDGSYRFIFKGALAESDQPEIELADWRTQMDYAAYEEILAAIRSLTGSDSGGGDSGGGVPDPSSTSLTLEQLTAELEAGRISLDSYLAKFGSALKNSIIKALPINDILRTLEQLFPQKPEISTKRIGEEMIKGSETGLLCTNFIVQVTATPVEEIKEVKNYVGNPCVVKGKTIKHKIKVRRRVNGKMKTSYKTVKTIKTVKTGACPQALVLREGKLNVSHFVVKSVKKTTNVKKVKLTITAPGLKGSVSKTFSVNKKTATISGQVVLPASIAKATRITVKVSGKNVAKQSRTVMPS